MLKRLVRKLPEDHPVLGPLRRALYLLWMRTRTPEQIFSGIHRHQAWQDAESVSGPGSTLAATAPLRAWLPGLFARHQIQSLLDLPCGDFNWMAHLDAPGLSYIGADVVPALVDHNRAAHPAPHRRFLHLDLLSSPLPAADVILCRDCLIHLSFADARRALGNIARSPLRLALLSTYPDWPANTDIPTGEWRPLNLQDAPFHLPPPLEIFQEDDGGGNPARAKHLALWHTTQLTP